MTVCTDDDISSATLLFNKLFCNLMMSYKQQSSKHEMDTAQMMNNPVNRPIEEMYHMRPTTQRGSSDRGNRTVKGVSHERKSALKKALSWTVSRYKN